MIVYIESNFVLELALRQEQASAAEDILKLAEDQKIELVLPSFAVSEPFSTLASRRAARNRLIEFLDAEQKQIGRPEVHRPMASAIDQLLEDLKTTSHSDGNALESTISQLLSVAALVGFDAAIYQSALTYRIDYDLEPVDAIIYASILADVKRRTSEEQKYFLSRDRVAFSNPDLRAELDRHNCRFFAHFGHARDRLVSQLPP